MFPRLSLSLSHPT